jgi:hypothetical protein
MKNNYVIPIVIIVGLGVLFFFPSPQSNFPAYVGTALLFIIIIIILFKQKNSKK